MNLTRRDFLQQTVFVTGALTLPSSLQAAGGDAGKSGKLESHHRPATYPRGHRDLPLPEWGPYSTVVYGISHIADRHRGLRFDVTLAPAILRNDSLVPQAAHGLPVLPLAADPRLGFIAWRYELAPDVHIDLEWAAVGEDGGLLRATVVNQSPQSQPVVLNWLARLAPPPIAPYQQLTAARPALVDLPPGAIWINALAYDGFEREQTRPSDHLVEDGRFRGEIFAADFVGNTGIGAGDFGKVKGDRVTWSFTLPARIADAVVRFRYRTNGGETAELTASGVLTDPIAFTATTDGNPVTLDIPAGDLAAGNHTLELVTEGGGASLELNGFVVVPRELADQIVFRSREWELKPQASVGDQSDSRILAFPGEFHHVYGLAWEGGTTAIRSAGTGQLSLLAGPMANFGGNSRSRLPQDGTGHVEIITPDVITVAPGETSTRVCRLVGGPASAVRSALAAFRTMGTGEIFQEARSRCPVFPAPSIGRDHRAGQERMAATLATNVIFPVWTGGRWIRHYCPGRLWNVVYTWDSGFIGLGLAQFAPELATAVLDVYLSPEDDDQAAFLHHGTPLPVQLYLFQELWNQHGDLEFARARYPRLVRFHRFLMGRVDGSTCRNLKSGLIRTFDYFYNSGGWDDYPPQVRMHQEKLAGHIAPVVNTAHAIRCAKLLRQLAAALNKPEDLPEWDTDIATLTEALQKFSWDEASGYFGYVLHDEALDPIGIYRHESGENFNQGLDGVSPLVAACCTDAQVKRIISHLTTPGKLMTPAGLTAVDRSAPYASRIGYWNGTVWMAHQWFIWKSLLDHGYGEIAHRIATIALDVWSDEIGATGRCCEQFDAITRKGGGWHPFGALSSPVLAWFAAYHRTGRLTTGFDTRIVWQKWNPDFTGLQARLELATERPQAVLFNLARKPGKVTWNDAPLAWLERLPGSYEVLLQGSGQLNCVSS